MKPLPRKSFFFSAFIYAILFIFSMVFFTASLKKEVAFETIQACYQTALKLRKRKKYRAALKLWHKGEMVFQQTNEKAGYYPSIWKGFLTAGSCLRQQGKNLAAIKIFNEGLRYHPLSPNLMMGKASAAKKSAHYEEAIQSLLWCQKLFPQDPKIAFHLAESYHKLKKPQQALSQYLQAWNNLQGKNNIKIFSLLPKIITLYLSLNNLEEARKLVNQASTLQLTAHERELLLRVENQLRQHEKNMKDVPGGKKTKE